MIRVTSFGVFSHSWRDDYIRRMQQLIPFRWIEIPLKRCPDKRPTSLLLEERQFLKTVTPFYLLDVKGRLYSSEEFSRWCLRNEDRHFVVGPAFGFHPDFRKQAKGMISLSPLTFTHGLAQTMLAEALYRSACILKNHPFVK